MLNLLLKRAPFLRLVIPLIAGIYFSSKVFVSSVCTVNFFIVLVILLVGSIVWMSRYPRYTYRYLPGLFLFLTIFAFGYNYSLVRAPQTIDHISQAEIKVQIIQDIGETDKNNKYEVYLNGFANDSLAPFVNSRGIVYLPKKLCTEKKLPGEYILAKGRFIGFDNQVDLFGFDYCGYLRNQRIAFRYIVSDFAPVEVVQKVLSPTIFSAKLKLALQKRFMENGLEQKNLAILNALFLGDKSWLTYEQKDAFSDAGAMHLLAVSGLHCGIIYLMLIGAIKALGFKNTNKYAVSFVLLSLWFYALITGFSPSVLRASIMFTIIEFGRLSKLKTTIFNLLGASMFIIIVIDPLAVFNIGFWLSHAAVASIVSFFPHINSWFYFSFPPFKMLWAIVSVTIAAQIGTIPIIIYVFNEFPNYFLLANVMLIPVVAPILLITVFASIMSFSPLALSFLLPALSDGLEYMQNVTLWINSLPYTIITNLSISWWILPIAYVSTVLLLLYAELRLTKYLQYYIMTLILLLGLLHIDIRQRPKEALFVANVSGKSVVNYFNEKENCIYTNEELSSKEIEYALRGVWSFCHAPRNFQTYILNFNSGHKPILKEINGNNIMILPSYIQLISSADTLSVDKCIVLTKPQMSVESLVMTIDFDELILPSGWRWYDKKKWLINAEEFVKNIHDVRVDGAFYMPSR